MLQIFTMIVPAVLMIIIAVVVAVNIIMGVFGGLKKRLAALVAIIVSAIVAAIVTTILCSPTSPVMTMATEKINELLTQAELGITVGVEPGSVGEAILFYVTMVAKPFVFTVIYALLSLILGIVMSIVSKFIPLFNKLSAVANRLGGAGVGLVCGLLVSLFLFVPFIGTIGVAADVIDSTGLLAEETDPEAPAEEVPSVKEAYEGFDYLGYGFLYDALASADYYGEKVYLREDVQIVVALIDKLGNVGTDLGSIDEEKAAEINSALDELEGSAMLRGVLAGVLSEASQSWLDGEAFLGMEKIEAGELYQPLIDTALGILATTDKDTVVPDLRTVVDMFQVLVKHGVLSTEGEESGDILDKLSDGAIIGELLAVVGENERMHPLADEITRLGLRTLATTLGIPEGNDERYNALMGEIATILNETASFSEADKYGSVSSRLQTAFGNYGVEVGGEALQSVAEGLIVDFDGESDITADDVKEFFILYAAASATDSSAAVKDGLVDLADSDTNGGVVDNGDGTISVNGVTLNNYTAENYSESYAFLAGKTGISFDDASTLYSAASMKSSLVTFEDILNLLGNYSDSTDIAAEAEKLGDIFGEFLSMVSDGGIDMNDTTAIFEKLGGILDEMQGSEVFGPEVAQKLLTAIMQSDALVDGLGLSRADLTEIANTINSHAGGKEGGFTSATGAVGSTVEAVKVNTKTDATKEEKIQAVESMIHNVNTENAEMLTSIITGNVVGSFNTSGIENSDKIADSLSSLINNMAQFKESAPSDEAVSAEADAVSQVLTLAMTGAESGAIFNTETSQGTVDTTPEEFIDTIISSDVVMQTVAQTVESEEQGGNPYGINYSNEEEAQTVANALETYYAENGGGEELAEKLENLAIVMNVEINLG